MLESLQTTMQTMLATQQATLLATQQVTTMATQPANAAATQPVDAVAIQPANNPHPDRGASWLKDFRRYNPHPFVGSKEDPTAAQMWIANMETTFESMRCPDEHKVACATNVLQKMQKCGGRIINRASTRVRGLQRGKPLRKPF